MSVQGCIWASKGYGVARKTHGVPNLWKKILASYRDLKSTTTEITMDKRYFIFYQKIYFFDAYMNFIIGCPKKD